MVDGIRVRIGTETECWFFYPSRSITSVAEAEAQILRHVGAGEVHLEVKLGDERWYEIDPHEH